MNNWFRTQGTPKKMLVRSVNSVKMQIDSSRTETEADQAIIKLKLMFII